MSGPIYLGFDLSTQQLKGVAVSSDLKSVGQAIFDFDRDAKGFEINKGVMTNDAEKEVFAPVSMWLQALDVVLTRLKNDGLDLSLIRGICGSGMQHGSVFWNSNAESLLASLDPNKSLEDQLNEGLAHPFSPNWQDASTQKECDEFDQVLGSPEKLAQATGSKAHHRFTGPQILRLQRKFPDRYENTVRINLVSSFLATIFLGKFAPFDISDVCGMNLWDINAGTWNEKALELTSGPFGVAALKEKLGHVPEDGGSHLGSISSYFVNRFGFSPDCEILASTGDNPSTILALPLRPNDAIVSLGTSSTFLMSTPEYLPDPSVHFFNHPTTSGLYMFMLCYKNGGLAREQVRDNINSILHPADVNSTSWADFDKYLAETPPLAQKDRSKDPIQLGIYFPRPEIVPNLPQGQWHYQYDASTDVLTQTAKTPHYPYEDARIIVESQFLSMRLRSRDLVRSPDGNLPPQPARIYLVGGGSRNRAIARLAGEVLGGSEGIFKLDLGENACALGAAYKAVWACERKQGQSFEDLIGSRWTESEFVERIADGYNKGMYERYGAAVKGFEAMEKELLAKYTDEKHTSGG